jgi:hypothetical protein
MALTLIASSDIKNASVAPPRLVDNLVLITGTGGFWMRVGETAAVPGADITDGTGSFYVPSGLEVNVEQGVALSFVRPAGTATTISIGRFS